MAAASSGNPDSALTVTAELSVCRAWRLRGGAADLLSSGQECPCCPGPSRPLPVSGGGRILGCVPRPSAPRPALLDSRPSRAVASSRSRRPSPSELLRVPPCALQPLGSSAHSPRGAGAC